jgi:glycosyltransferase involved in cell wall biosynthesis
MKQLVFAFPAQLSTPTGGYIYDRKIIEGLKARGWHIQLLSLGDGFPFPEQQVVDQARLLLLELPLGIPVVIDGLALGALPEVIAELAIRNPVIALIHHPLAFESGLSVAQSEVLKASETQALRRVTKVIATSEATARDLIAHFGVKSKSIDVVYPGTERTAAHLNETQRPELPGGELRLLSVGSIIPRKGYDILLAALYPLKKFQWTLTIAGDATRDALAPVQLQKDIARFGFEDRVQVLGAVDDQALELLYQQADVFVLASRFEGYGMAYAEALAHGLPVIGTTGGAIPDTVPESAGILVPPGDVESLTLALRTLILDSQCRARLSCGAKEAAANQPTWDDAADHFSAALFRMLD